MQHAGEVQPLVRLAWRAALQQPRVGALHLRASARHAPCVPQRGRKPGACARAGRPRASPGHAPTAPLAPQDENTDVTLAELARTPWGAAALACEALALVGMAPFLYIEAATLREYGPRAWTSAWNAMDVVAYAVQARRGPPAQRACRLRAGARRAACIRRPGRGTDGMPAACVCQPGCRPAVRAPDPPRVRRARASDARARAPQIAITVMHLGRLGLASNTLSVLVAFQVLLLWVKAQYFARQAPTPLFSPVSGTGAGSSGTHVCVCPVATHDTVQQVVRSLAPAAEVPDVLALMQAASLLCPAGRRALQPAKNPFLDTLKTVVVDIRFFLFLLLLTVWGFACAFYILFRRDQSKHVRPASITSTTLLSALPRHCEPAGCEAARLNARPPHACKSVLPTCARSLLCCASVPPVLRGAASCAGGLVALQRRDACHRGWRRTRSPILV